MFQGLSPRRPLGRTPYAVFGAAALLIPHLMLPLAWLMGWQSPGPDVWFWFSPMRWLTSNGLLEGGEGLVYVMLALAVVSGWLSVLLAGRRALDGRVSGWWAAAMLIPVIQYGVFIRLLVPPLTPAPEDAAPAEGALADGFWKPAAEAILWSLALVIVAVGVGALVFRSYGAALFVTTPFLIGAICGFLCNRRGDIGFSKTLGVMTAALVIASLALVAVALEGIICIIMAAPIIWVMALIGAIVGVPIARIGRPGARPPLMVLAVLPLAFAVEQFEPHTATFDDSRSVTVAASPLETWDAVLHMKTIEETPALPFGLGVAYPVRGEVTGDGVGAIRRGYFSTGVATERVTEWAPGKALGFTILSEPPVMRELSPWPKMRTPHVEGYFRSVDARILLEPLPTGETRLTLFTRHELDLEPAVYWLPFARWIVQQNKARVLGQMKRQAEAAAEA
jgi:hypothetical protein